MVASAARVLDAKYRATGGSICIEVAPAVFDHLGASRMTTPVSPNGTPVLLAST